MTFEIRFYATVVKSYISNPQQLPDKTIYSLYKMINSDNIEKKWKEYENPRVKDDKKTITRIVGDLRDDLKNDQHGELFKPTLLRVIADYISGMTDSYALKEYRKIYG